MKTFAISALVLLATFSISFAAPVYNPNNGHYYERIDDGLVNWHQAKDLAESRTLMGVAGHLATVTSAEENWWIVDNLGGPLTVHHLLGGYFDGTEWSWITGEPWGYTNWWPGEPSGDGNPDACLNYDDDGTGTPGYFNDYGLTGTDHGYIVEYDGPFPTRRAGDLDNSGDVELQDAILSLKVVSGIDATTMIFLTADVNNDSQIGLEEAVFILQTLSGLRP